VGSTDFTLNDRTIHYGSGDGVIILPLMTHRCAPKDINHWAYVMLFVDPSYYSYLEPSFGILFSVIFVGETLTLPQIMGGILILGSTYIGEMLKDGKLSNIDTCMEQQNNKQNSKKAALFLRERS